MNNISECHKKYFIWIVLTVIVVFSVGVRLRLADIPLERDEGEYAYGAQLLLNGLPPYQYLYSMKLPGIYIAYAGMMMIFGQSHQGIHRGLALINIATLILLFLLCRRLFGELAALMSAASFSILSMGQHVRGFFANSEHFVLLPIIGGTLLLIRALDDQRSGWHLFLSGLLFGTGFLMKQHGAAFVGFGMLYVLIELMLKQPRSFRTLLLSCAAFGFGTVMPWLLCAVILYCLGAFEKFWFWTVDYALRYTSQVPLDLAREGFKARSSAVIGSAPLIWILSGIGLFSLVWDKRARQHYRFVMLFVFFSLLSICPGFYFRPHYFILFLPAAAMLSGISISALSHKISAKALWKFNDILPITLAVICMTASLYQQRHQMFLMSPEQVCRATYPLRPFPESIEVGKFIKENSSENDRIAILGSEPQIYFYSGRQAASGYVYMYPMMENHDYALDMQKEMIREIEMDRPEYVVFIHCNTSWLKHLDSKDILSKWFQTYRQKNYSLRGWVDIFKDKSDYHWNCGDESLELYPRSDNWVAVLRINR